MNTNELIWHALTIPLDTLCANEREKEEENKKRNKGTMIYAHALKLTAWWFYETKSDQVAYAMAHDMPNIKIKKKTYTYIAQTSRNEVKWMEKAEKEKKNKKEWTLHTNVNNIKIQCHHDSWNSWNSSSDDFSCEQIIIKIMKIKIWPRWRKKRRRMKREKLLYNKVLPSIYGNKLVSEHIMRSDV